MMRAILKQRISNIFINRRMLWDMSVSQFKARYAGLILGAWWVILIPLMMALCINFVFVLAFKVDTPNYLFFILSGIFPWFFISQAISDVTNAFTANKGILRQGVFPREFIPISSVLSSFITFILGFGIIVPLFILFNGTFIYLLPMLVLIILLNLIFVLGIGLVFAVLNSFLRDVSYFLSVGLMFWFWMTPVFYSENMLGFPYRWICLANPATYYISAYHKILYSSQLPAMAEVLFLCVLSFLTLVLGYIFYLKNEAGILKKI